MTTFDGNWLMVAARSGVKQYGMKIQGSFGICTKTNSPRFSEGDVILHIESASDNMFFGKQIFTDGIWYEVSGRLEGNKLYMLGGTDRWQMQKM